MPGIVGFIGLGSMGEPIAENLRRAGYDLRVYNRTRSKAAQLVEKGAVLVTAPSEVAQRGGIVLTMLADDRAVEQICFGEPSFVEALGNGGVHLSLSTISPSTARRLAEHHKKYGVAYVASPVFGQPAAAAALSVCLAGPALGKKRVEPLLKAIGHTVVDFGDDPGAANVMKLCGNFLIASTVATLAEMMVLAEKNGLSKKQVAEMIGLFSPLHHGYASAMAEGRFEPPGFRLALGFKDINLILETAAASLTPLPVASVLHDRWLSSIAKKRGNMDWSAVILDVAEEAGLKAKVATP